MKQFIYPYIMYKNTNEAVEYYKGIFDAKVNYTMLGKDTPNCPEDQLERVMHLELIIEDSLFYMADDEIEDLGRIHLHLDYQDLDNMKKVFEKMKKEGNVLQEIGETYWGAVFGIIKDKFNITWQFHHKLPNNQDE